MTMPSAIAGTGIVPFVTTGTIRVWAEAYN
jgi:hypothetical protein